MDYLYIILFCALAVIIIGAYTYTLQKKYKEEGSKAVVKDLQNTVFALMLAAQKKWGQGPGKDKFAWVVEQMYLYVAPEILDRYAPDVNKFVQERYNYFYDKLMDYMEPAKDKQVKVVISDDERESLLTNDNEPPVTKDEI